MKAIMILVISVIFITNVTAQLSAPTKEIYVDTTFLNKLSFLTGCWEINNPEKGLFVTEQWMAPRGGVMIGMSRTLKQEKLAGFEYMRIIQDVSGVRFISKPGENVEETKFPLRKIILNEATFENLTHDFPQRIIYKLTKPNALSARIEGMVNGKLKGIDFPMTRAKCN